MNQDCTNLTDAASPEAASIVVDHDRATVFAPAWATVTIRAALGCFASDFQVGGDGTTVLRNRLLDFHRADHRGRVLARPGHAPLIRRMLEDQGLAVEVEDLRRFPARFAPHAGVLAAAVGREREVLEAVIAQPLGQIETPEKQLAPTIASICRLYPTLDVLVLTASGKRGRDLARKLGGALRERVQFAMGHWYVEQRVVVAPYTYTTASLWQLVLFPDPQELGNKIAMQKAQTALGGPQQLYAFVPPGARFSQRQRLSVELVTGEVIFSTAPKPAAVKVQVCRAGSFPIADDLDGLARKQALWQDERRNDLIATAALRFARRELAGLQSLGLMLDLTDEQWLAEGDDRKIAVLVESTEHGRQLQRRLPGWALLADNHAVEPVASTAQADMRRGVIITFAWAAKSTIYADVLIRADGGVTPTELFKFPPPADFSRRVYLIDIDDDADRRAGRDLSRRLWEYQHRDWIIQELNAVTDTPDPERDENARCIPITNSRVPSAPQSDGTPIAPSNSVADSVTAPRGPDGEGAVHPAGEDVVDEVETISRPQPNRVTKARRLPDSLLPKSRRETGSKASGTGLKLSRPKRPERRNKR